MRAFHAAHDDLAHAVKSGRVAEVPALVDAQEVRVNQVRLTHSLCSQHFPLYSLLFLLFAVTFSC